MMTKQEANYRMPDSCCQVCINSMLNEYGEPCCSKLKSIHKPFPYNADNSVDLGAVCDQFSKSEVILQPPVKEYIDPYGDCKLKGKGFCDEKCDGCDAYSPTPKEEEVETMGAVLVSCVHYGSGSCDHNCIGCADYSGPNTDITDVLDDVEFDIEQQEIEETIYEADITDELDGTTDCRYWSTDKCDHNCDGCGDYCV